MIDGWKPVRGQKRSPKSPVWRVAVAFVCALAWSSTAWLHAASATNFQAEFLAGNYDRVIREMQVGVATSPERGDWHKLLVESLLAVGRYPEADAAMTEGLAGDPTNLGLRWLAREVARANGRPAEGDKRAEEVRQFVVSRSYAYRAPADLVVFGRAALLAGADPKEVLDKVYAVAQKGDPKLRDVYLARGELALEKHDAPLAAAAYGEGRKLFPADPEFAYGVARAYEDGDRKQVMSALDDALKLNPHHVPTLLMLAEHQIDAEEYETALALLDQVEKVNPAQPDMWAFRAVVSHLRNDAADEKSARDQALNYWKTNPRVDFLIGKKLAAKYRFAEGASYQRQALEFDPVYLPAKAELASDLLRLGEEAEGWKLAQEVHTADAYDVEAFNLVTLEDTMAKYATINTGDFTVRMSGHEATVYGSQVVELLTKARGVLSEKYGIELARPTFVEIFAEQKDFAVRTFGMPDVAGFLGVCFGRVVTANSPAASPANWQAVLWHEFCHVITLQLTQNKMPRWLSEGISVYEETQANPAWGMRLSPRFRDMIMGEDLVPVSKLSAAFLAPPTPAHLQFAYFESAWVVEFMVQRFGQAALKGVLDDLRQGKEINAAIAAHTVPIQEFEKAFTTYARDRVKQIAPKLDWTNPPPDLLDPDAAAELAEWGKDRPDNYWALRLKGVKLMIAKNWPEAEAVLKHLVELYPSQVGSDSPISLLAATYRAQRNTAKEQETLIKWAENDDDAPAAYTRLIELGRESKDWAMVATNAKRFLAVNPLVALPYRALGQASTETGDWPAAIRAYQTVLQLDPTDPAEAHFLLAQSLHRVADPDAKRQVLQALEEAPRYRAALDLLVEINRPVAEATPATKPATSALP
jgi:tetratricopeptide (TPR) repeat protein